MSAVDTHFHYLSEAGIPYSRLHDTGGIYGQNRYVDIANIFRSFDADADNPESYDFAFTDVLLTSLAKENVKPFFRLGATIENQHYIKAYNIFPPKDNLKWAKICEKIIMHYNEGWANGYHLGIEYWEIWNEPENDILPENNPMWKGTFSQYTNLYKTAAVYLKNRFPNIKIGGYASCGMYGIDEHEKFPFLEEKRKQYFLDCFDIFLKEVKENNVPLDFFSWHSYAETEITVKHARYVRNKLDSLGFCKTESILDEWNPGIQRRGTLCDSAKISEMMIAMQNEEVDMLMYYDGQIHGAYQGLFNPINIKPFKAYYVFAAFSELYRLKNAAQISDLPSNISCAAASKGTNFASVITNTGLDKKINIEFIGTNKTAELYKLNEEYNLELFGNIETGKTTELKVAENETVLIKA